MSQFYNTDNPDSLDVLLEKALAVNTINKENLEFITNSSKALKQTTIPNHNTKKRRIQNPIDRIIQSWRYYGELLEKEKIAFNDFIDLELITFDDLKRLVEDYHLLLKNYKRTLKDAKKSRVAVEIILRNLEIIQVAVGEVHIQVIEITDTVEEGKQSSRISFTNVQELKNKITLSDQAECIYKLDTFVANGKHYLVSGSDKDIQVWDLSNNKLVTTLEASGELMVLFIWGGVQMLANVDRHSEINIWNLSTRTKVKTLKDENYYCDDIRALTIIERGDRPILLSLDEDEGVCYWDVDCGKVISNFHLGTEAVYSLYLFHRANKPWIVTCHYGGNEPVKVWDLQTQTEKAVFYVPEDSFVVSSVATNHNGEQILMAFGCSGKIQMWSLENYKDMGFEKVSKGFSGDHFICLEVLECDEKRYLACIGDDATVTIWDIKEKSQVVTLSTEMQVNAMTVFMNGDKPCLVTGDCKGSIKFWME